MKKSILVSMMVLLLTGCTTQQPSLLDVAQQAQDIEPVAVQYYRAVDQTSEVFNKNLIPAGSYMIGCDDYIVRTAGPKVRSIDYVDMVQTALSQVLYNNLDEGMYVNPLYNFFTLENIEVNDEGIVQVYLASDNEVENECQGLLLRALIEQTVEANGFSQYDIYLNNSHTEWLCLSQTC